MALPEQARRKPRIGTCCLSRLELGPDPLDGHRVRERIRTSEHAEAMGAWTSRELFGLHAPPERPAAYLVTTRADSFGYWTHSVVALTTETYRKGRQAGARADRGQLGRSCLICCKTILRLGTKNILIQETVLSEF